LLEGIDTPERAQPFGQKARQALAKKVFGKVVRVDDLGKDRYGRTLGIVRLGKRNVNLELVREGWAWCPSPAILYNPIGWSDQQVSPPKWGI
jgi:micrococcal nuclease